jgi:hypothetical protein
VHISLCSIRQDILKGESVNSNRRFHMQKWEYKVKPVSGFRVNAANNVLNIEGRSAWELVSVIENLGKRVGEEYLAFLKRPKEE